MRTCIILSLLLFSTLIYSQKIERIEPMNWWVGMKNEKLQLMVHGEKIALSDVTLNNAQGVDIEQVTKVDSENYLFIDLTISPDAKAGQFEIIFTHGKKKITQKYELLEREKDSAEREGFSSADAIMLIMPDRFVNGNKENDNIPGMKEMADYNAPYGRHGGDLQGVIEHLDYIESLGMTAIWLNPVQENDMPQASYHGYAITDYYNVDPRLGTIEEYKQLTELCHKRGMKMIMDMVFNHCGTEHFWMSDLPSKDWLNEWPEYTNSSYRLSTISDPNASQYDKKLTTKGWFDKTMADLNMKNEFVRNYLIQNSLWWIETVGLDGIRQDTYPYSDKDAMRQWQLRVREEYPNFNIVGETWIAQPSKLCYWQKDFPNKDGFNSELPTIMDFALQSAIIQGLMEEESWDGGLNRIYDVLADDHLYPNTNNLLIFAENHDLGRLKFMLGEDLQKVKLATILIATLRGIPQLYIGSEIAMTGNGFAGHCNIREDFPVEKFLRDNRSEEENDLYDFTATVFNYRKHSEALQKGKTVQFLPQDGIYVYFRLTENQKIMVVINKNEEAKQLLTSRFSEILSGENHGHEIITNTSLTLENIDIPAMSGMMIEVE